MNRPQISPLRLRSKKIEIDVNRIINHAAKLVKEYNERKINSIMQSERENQEKVHELLRLSTAHLPRLIHPSRHRQIKEAKSSKTHSKMKRKTSKKQNSDRSTSGTASESNDENETLSVTENGNKKEGSEIKSHSKTISSHKSQRKVFPSDATNEDNQVLSNQTIDSTTSLALGSSRRNKQSSAAKNKSEINDVISSNTQISLSSDPDNRLLSNRTMDEALSLISVHSQKNGQSNELEATTDNVKTECTFIYDIEIKTGEQENKCLITDVFLIINGQITSTTSSLHLKQFFNLHQHGMVPFQPGNADRFQIPLPDHLGLIQNIVIGLTSPLQDKSWFLEYIRIKDNYSSKEYRFPCRRWLGINSADNLSEVTLGYTPPNNAQQYQSPTPNDTEAIIESEKSRHSSMTNRNSSLQSNKSYDDTFTQEASLRPQVENHSLEEGKHEAMDSVSRESDLNEKLHSNDENAALPVSALFGKCIHKAAITGDYERMNELCSVNDSLKCSQDNNGNDPIHLAAIFYQPGPEYQKIFNYLRSLNVDPNMKSKDGYTPLHLAIINGNLASVKYLNETVKVNRDIRDKDDNTALHLATLNCHNLIVKYLLSNADDISVKNRFDETPMVIAQRMGQQKLINIFNKILDSDNLSSEDEYVIDKNNDEKDLCFTVKEKKNSMDSEAEILYADETNQIDYETPKTQSDPSNNLISEFVDIKYPKDILNNKTDEDVISVMRPTDSDNLDPVKNDCLEENYKNDNDNNSLIIDNDNEEDNRGILFNKHFPVLETTVPKPNLNLTNLRSVRFDDDLSSVSVLSGTNISSSVSSTVSSSITTSRTSSCTETIRNSNTSVTNKVESTDKDLLLEPSQVTRNELEINTELSGHCSNANVNVSLVTEKEEKEVSERNIEHTKKSENAIDKIESERIGTFD